MSPETDLDKLPTVAEHLALSREMALLHAKCRGLSMRLQVLIEKAERQGSLSAEDVKKALDEINLGLSVNAPAQVKGAKA